MRKPRGMKVGFSVAHVLARNLRILTATSLTICGFSCSEQGSKKTSIQDAPSAVPVATTQAAVAVGPSIDWADYGLVLNRVAGADSVRCNDLRASEPLIERMLARLAVNGPKKAQLHFPESQSKTAYYINAHNLMMLAEMEGVLVSRQVGRWPPAPMNARAWTIDGVSETVFTLREKAIRESGDDWRVRMAIFSGRRDGPALWPRMILGDMLDLQLDEITRAAIASPRVVLIDHGLVKQLLLCDELFEIQGRLVADYERRLDTQGASILNVLLEWAAPFNRETLNSAVGYKVARLPRDARMPVSATP